MLTFITTIFTMWNPKIKSYLHVCPGLSKIPDPCKKKFTTFHRCLELELVQLWYNIPINRSKVNVMAAMVHTQLLTNQYLTLSKQTTAQSRIYAQTLMQGCPSSQDPKMHA